MSDVPFHLTRMGIRYYEHTMPEIVRQLTRLNEHFKLVANAFEKPYLPAATPAESDPSDPSANA